MTKELAETISAAISFLCACAAIYIVWKGIRK